MRINTSSARSVQNKARGAATGKWMTILARFGYAAKGVVYVLIGVLAVLAGFGHGGSTTDRKGALITLHNQPFGVVLLIIVAIGLLCYALWSFIQAIFDTEGKGHEAKGIIARIGYAAVGVSYLLPAYAAYQVVIGHSSGKSSTASTQFWTAEFLRQPLGFALIIIAGLVVLGVAIGQFVQAYNGKFRYRLSLTGLSARLSKQIVFLGRFGLAARGVVFGIIGVFLIVAALQHNAGEARGLDTALQTLAQQPFGQVLLVIVALGFVAYGAYSFVEARYRLINGR